MKIAVLGGSTPFTLAFFEALRDADGLPGMELRLLGQDHAATRCVAGFAARFLAERGTTATACETLAETLRGADVVLHQIRYGDMAGRDADERLSLAMGVPADETLGPGGLRAALRTGARMGPVGDALARHCPDAWIINLTNPLSVVTALLHRRHGLSRVVGVCELPVYTAERVAEVLAVPPGALHWAYSGLNHRGFLHHLRVAGADALPALLDRLPPAGIGGVRRDEIAAMQAVPLKYFALLARPGDHLMPGRAPKLAELRARLLRELREGAVALPAAMAERNMPWYRDAVLPVLRAIAGRDPGPLVLSLPGDGPVTPEGPAAFDGRAFRLLEQPAPPHPAARELERYRRHEALVMAAVEDPGPATVAAALRADPLIPPERLQGCLAQAGGVLDAGA